MGPVVSRTSVRSALLAACVVSVGGMFAPTALAQATIRSRDLTSDWASVAPLSPGTAYVPSWNAQPNSWRLGVAIENVDTGVMLTDIERGMPAERSGLEKGDVIVNVDGFQVGYVNGALYDLGDEIRRRVDQQGRVNFLVFNQRNRRVQNLRVTLVQQSASGVRGEVICRERITLTQQAVLTVRLRDVTYPTWTNVEVGKHVIPNPKHPPIPFAIELDPTLIYPDHKYAVDAYLVDRGQIVLQSTAAVPVNPQSNNTGLQVQLVKVGSSVPPSNTYVSAIPPTRGAAAGAGRVAGAPSGGASAAGYSRVHSWQSGVLRSRGQLGEPVSGRGAAGAPRSATHGGRAAAVRDAVSAVRRGADGLCSRCAADAAWGAIDAGPIPFMTTRRRAIPSCPG
jgi:uncharacterized lipoprotein YbaY